MSYRIIVRPDAQADMFEAGSWYDQQRTGLGTEFSEAAQLSIDSLANFPLRHTIHNQELGVRWLILRRFPYLVVYQVTGDEVIIIAVTHAARDESAWKERL